MSHPKIHIDATGSRTTIKIGASITIVVDSEPSGDAGPAPTDIVKVVEEVVAKLDEIAPAPLESATPDPRNESAHDWATGAPSGCTAPQSCAMLHGCRSQCGAFDAPAESAEIPESPI